MAVKWTKQQEEALSERGKNILLSAAAGSGKTAVLTERITRLLADAAHLVSINELLVLTFTKAAAAEMKSRISASLTKALARAKKDHDLRLADHLEKQVTLMGSARISTLDAFFQSLLKQYFYLVDMDPQFRVLSDENERDLLEDDVLSDVLEQRYEKGDKDFLALADSFVSGFRDGSLKAAILSICRYARSMPFPEDWISKLSMAYDIPAGDDLDALSWAEPALENIREQASQIVLKYEEAFQFIEKNDRNDVLKNTYEATFLEESDNFKKLAGVKNWKALRTLVDTEFGEKKTPLKKRLPSFKVPKDISPEDKEELTKLKEKLVGAKDVTNSLRSKIKNSNIKLASLLVITEEQWIAQTRAMKPYVQTLADISIEFLHRLSEKKREEGLVDFNDMEHYALDILLRKDDPHFTPERAREFPSDAALALRERYREILIDEYQDTNGVQDLITSLISNDHNRFLVGDIKQSIYRFRQADPTIFLEKYKSFSPDPHAAGRRMDLNKNFRSDKAILSSVNFIFRQLMTEDTLELNYGNAEALYFSRHEEKRPKDYVGGQVSISLIDDSALDDIDDEDLQDLERIQKEGRFIAQKIRDIIDNKKQVMNMDGTFRPAGYGDMVILLRSADTKAYPLLHELSEAGIPAMAEKEDDFMDTPEIVVLLSLLKILDNPYQDLPLAAVLRSPLCGLDETDLARLRHGGWGPYKPLWQILSKTKDMISKEAARKVNAFCALYKAWNHLSSQSGVAPLLQRILEDTDYLTYISGLEGGAGRKNHVESFYRLALRRDRDTHNGLHDFLHYIDRLVKSKKEFSSLPSATSSDAVRIMTIHKSKGLESPIVFLPDLAKSFNEKDLNNTVLLHKNMGLGIKYFDKEENSRWPTLYWYAVREAVKKSNRAEDARLLYVAMTRARDALFLIAAPGKMESSLSKWLFIYPDIKDNASVSPMPRALVSRSGSYLDWIMPAATRHRTMEPFWNEAGATPQYEEDAPGDESNFTFEIISTETLLTEDEAKILQEERAKAAQEAVKEKSAGEGTSEPETVPEDESASEAAPANGAAAEPISDSKEAEARITPDTLPTAPVPDWMRKQLNWKYEWPVAVTTPAKITATAAVKLQEQQENETADQAPVSSAVLTDIHPKSAFIVPDAYREPPDFLRKATDRTSGASYGTLMHKIMEKTDFTTLKEGEDPLKDHIRHLVQDGILSQDEANLVLQGSSDRKPLEDLLTFENSEAADLMKSAKVIHKEMPFSILLPANTFYKDCEDGEEIFLQGVMDCLLEFDDHIIIIDYKTDSEATESELRKHYRIQLQAYGRAATDLLGKPVTRLSLWSFRFGKLIDIPVK